MSSQHKNLLKELGFDTNLMGTIYFVSICEQIQELIDSNDGNLDKALEKIPHSFHGIYDYINSLYLEDYAFYFECGKNKYMEAMDEFINSKKIVNQEQEELNKKVFGITYNYEMNKEDLILVLCMYLNNKQKEQDNKDLKILKRSKNF